MQKVFFRCKICSKQLVIDLDDPSTFLHKNESGDSTIEKLFSIRTSHQYNDNIQHINVIMVDANGEYRAHVDTYEESTIAVDESYWQLIRSQFPIELKPYLSVITVSEKRLFSSLPQPFDASPQGWKSNLFSLWDKNPENNLIAFLATKWALIVGDVESLMIRSIDKSSWAYPLILKAQTQMSVETDIYDEVKNIDYTNFPLIIKADTVAAIAEIYSRLSKYHDLVDLYLNFKERWKDNKELAIKMAILSIQAEYGYIKYYQGDLNEAFRLIEEAYNFALAISNRVMIQSIGVLYANLLRSKGNLSRALEIFQKSLKISKELTNERSEIVISTNIGMIESIQGKTAHALEVFLRAYKSPITKFNFNIRYSLLGNISRTYYKLGNFDKALEYCNQALMEGKKLPIQMKLSLYQILSRIAKATNDISMIINIEENLPDDIFFDSVNGKIFLKDLEATKAQIAHQWNLAAKRLEEELELTKQQKNIEQIANLELEIAEVYFNLFHQTKQNQFFENCYNHLELSREIAEETDNISKKIELTILKGLLALEVDMRSRALHYFEEAKNIAIENTLFKFEQKSKDLINKMQKNELEGSPKIRNTFKDLKLVSPHISRVKKKQHVVYCFWLKSLNNKFDKIITTSETKDNQVDSMRAIRDLWLISNNYPSRKGITSIKNEELGTILIEQTKDFQLLAMCNKASYQTRSNIQLILDSLQNFPFKFVLKELEDKTIELFRERDYDITYAPLSLSEEVV